MPDIQEAATRKLGPLPAWGWGVAVGGAVLVFRLIRPKSATSSAQPSPTATVVGGGGSLTGSGPDATPTDPFSGANSLVQQLQGQINDLTGQVNSEQGTITDQAGLISGLQGTVSSLGDFQALQTKLIGFLNQRATLLSNIAVTQTNLNTYRDNLSKCKTQACRDKWNAQIKQKTGYIASWNTQLTAVNKNIADTQTQLGKTS